MMSAIRPLSYAWTAHKWKKFNRLWLDRPDIKFHWVRYEDVSGKPMEALKGILNYLEVRVSDKLIQEAIDNFTFDKMAGRKKGQEATKSMPFRKGIVGDFRNKFTLLEFAIFHMIAGECMRELGYKAK